VSTKEGNKLMRQNRERTIRQEREDGKGEEENQIKGGERFKRG